MPTLEDVKNWQGQDVMGPDGEKIGSIEDIYLDRSSGEPEWAAVKTGLFGSSLSFVPIEGAGTGDGGVRVAYDKAKVKDAPNVEADGELSPEEEQRLYTYYGRGYDDWDGQTDRTETVGRDTSGGGTDDAMTRSEEELRVGKTQREVGKARLKKHIVTENVTTTVPVQREEVRIEREPITDANVGDALDGPDLSEEEHEVTLHQEEVVVDKDVVAKERVRLDKDTVVENREVSEEVRKEVIDADTGDANLTDRDTRN
jgi:uncharacterized protein (TIGR02271 family)